MALCKSSQLDNGILLIDKQSDGHEHHMMLAETDHDILRRAARSINVRDPNRNGNASAKARNPRVWQSKNSESASSATGSLQSYNASSASQSSSLTSEGEVTDQPDKQSAQQAKGPPNNPPASKDLALEIVQPSPLRGFVIFGVHGSRRLQELRVRLAQIDVEVFKSDDDFFDEMTAQYRELRGYMRWVFSIWIFRTCELVVVCSSPYRLGD